jgi:iduronate 2-sulfatase
VVAPGLARPGTTTQALAETVDIFPTLAELAGLPAPGGPQPVDGTSLVPVLKNPARAIKDHVYHVFPRGVRGKELLGRAVRTERYRLVEWKEAGAPAASAEYELYDYTEDPLEKQNLAQEQSEVVAQMKSKLDRHPEALPPIEIRLRAASRR